MSFVFWETDPPSLENYTLILPCISVGNVGQLAVDLLLNNLNVTKIAYIHHPCFIPIVGADPFDPNCIKLTTSCQIYECKEKKLIIIQQRSPLVHGKISEYRDFLINFIKEQKIKQTIMLCSSFSQYFAIEDIRGTPMYYLSCQSEEEVLKRMSWKPFALPEQVNTSETSPIPGGGVAKHFLEDCNKESIPLVIAILLCSEGNNYPEAFRMVERLNEWLTLKEISSSDQWIMPISWTLPYGSDAPRTLY